MEREITRGKLCPIFLIGWPSWGKRVKKKQSKSKCDTKSDAQFVHDDPMRRKSNLR